MTKRGTWGEALLSAELGDRLAEDCDLSLIGFSDGVLDKLLAFGPKGDGEPDGGASVLPATIPGHSSRLRHAHRQVGFVRARPVIAALRHTARDPAEGAVALPRPGQYRGLRPGRG